MFCAFDAVVLAEAWSEGALSATSQGKGMRSVQVDVYWLCFELCPVFRDQVDELDLIEIPSVRLRMC